MQHHPNLPEILRWYADMGVDECIGETPVNRYAVPDAPQHTQPDARSGTPPGAGQQPPDRQPSASGRPPPAPAAMPVPRTQAVEDACTAARAADSLEALYEAIRVFNGCALKKTATNTVIFRGNPSAPLMLIGEAPGADEDRQGAPFVGASGQLLDRMLASIGVDPAEGAYVTNLVFWRPPGNRNPDTHEIAACLPFVERHIELVDPKVLVLLGAPAAKTLLGKTQSIGKLRGRWFDYETPGLSHPIRARPLFHPAYLLRTPDQKRLAWRDLLDIRAALAQSP